MIKQIRIKINYINSKIMMGLDIDNTKFNPQELKRNNLLFIVSAPSGAGKTTLYKQVLKVVSNLKFSISYTTRTKRTNEIDGKDYFFVSKDIFKKMIDNQELLEWAEVHGNFYGTSKKLIQEFMDNGDDVLLDIDIQGGRQLKEKATKAVYIFIMPPSMNILEERLRGRSSDPEEAISKRLNNAYTEMQAYREYDYVIINDDLNMSIDCLVSILKAERCKVAYLSSSSANEENCFE